MSSREKILNTIKQNQPQGKALPALDFNTSIEKPKERFIAVLSGIGGKILEVNSWNEIEAYIKLHFNDKKVFRFTPDHNQNQAIFDADPHLLEDVHLAVLQGHFGVAESGAIWITSALMGDSALPFISENLALVINVKDIVPTLLEAYDRIGSESYNLGTFIAGPSKTADIEQSLVLGAHGPKTLTVFVLS